VKRLAELVDQFDEYYNTARPHQGLDTPDQTPAQAYQAKPKALPAPAPIIDPPRQPTRHPDTTPVPRGAPRGRYNNFKDATPADAGGLRHVDRHVLASGRISVCGCLIYISRRRKGETMHILFDDHTIQVIDTNGVILGHLDRPADTQPSRHQYRLSQ